MFLSCCINFLPFPSCPFISFLKLWNSLYGLARGPSATKVITKLSLRLSLNNQPLQHMTLDIFRRKFATNRWRERERERKKKEKEKQKHSEREGTTAWIFLIGFARSVNVHNSICLVYAKFNRLSCMVPGYRFWGGAYRFTVFRAHLWQKTPAILKWSSTILTVTHLCTCNLNSRCSISDARNMQRDCPPAHPNSTTSTTNAPRNTITTELMIVPIICPTILSFNWSPEKIGEVIAYHG